MPSEGPIPVHPIADRNRARTLTAFVAVDTIEVIERRITNLARSGRLVTLVTRYHDSRETTVKPGLSLSINERLGGIQSFTNASPHGRGLSVHLSPGIVSYGVSAYANDGDEDEVRRRYHSDSPRDAVYITITGGDSDDPGYANLDDSIVIDRYNEHGARHHTTVAFAYVSPKDRIDAEARVLDWLVDRAPDGGWPTEALRALADEIREDWVPLAERRNQPATLS